MKIEAKKNKTVAYGDFATGIEVVTGKWGPFAHWKGQNSVRQKADKIYICLMGQDTVAGSRRFVERVYEANYSAEAITYLEKNIDRVEFIEHETKRGLGVIAVPQSEWA